MRLSKHGSAREFNPASSPGFDIGFRHDSTSLNPIFMCKIWVMIPHMVGIRIKGDHACDSVF